MKRIAVSRLGGRAGGGAPTVMLPSAPAPEPILEQNPLQILWTSKAARVTVPTSGTAQFSGQRSGPEVEVAAASPGEGR
jgi:hypothetical protein